jgi:hypothetical protein
MDYNSIADSLYGNLKNKLAKSAKISTITNIVNTFNATPDYIYDSTKLMTALKENIQSTAFTRITSPTTGALETRTKVLGDIIGNVNQINQALDQLNIEGRKSAVTATTMKKLQELVVEGKTKTSKGNDLKIFDAIYGDISNIKGFAAEAIAALKLKSLGYDVALTGENVGPGAFVTDSRDLVIRNINAEGITADLGITVKDYKVKGTTANPYVDLGVRSSSFTASTLVFLTRQGYVDIMNDMAFYFHCIRYNQENKKNSDLAGVRNLAKVILLDDLYSQDNYDRFGLHLGIINGRMEAAYDTLPLSWQDIKYAQDGFRKVVPGYNPGSISPTYDDFTDGDVTALQYLRRYNDLSLKIKYKLMLKEVT